MAGAATHYEVVNISGPLYADLRALQPSRPGGVGSYGEQNDQGFFATEIFEALDVKWLGGFEELRASDDFLNASVTVPAAIDDRGLVVGRAKYGGVWKAFSYEGGTFTNLDRSLDSYWSAAVDVNATGLALVIAGGDQETPEQQTSYVFNLRTQAVDTVQHLPGCSATALLGINRKGVAVGSCWNDDLVQRAVMYRSGSLDELLPSPSRAIDVGDSGQVLGMRGLPERGFLWERGHVTDLPAGFDPVAINEQGTVVGVGRDAAGRHRGYLYTHGQVVELTSLCTSLRTGWSVSNVRDINNAGYISIWASDDRGEVGAGLLSPVPAKAVYGAAKMYETLFGVIQDGGGIVIGPRGPVPIDPWGPKVAGGRFGDLQGALDMLSAAEGIRSEEVRDLAVAAVQDVVVAAQREIAGRHR